MHEILPSNICHVFFENFDLGGNCLEKKKNWTFFWKLFKIVKNFENPR